MNVFIDTNVAIDVLIRREPFYQHSKLVLLASERKHINGFISASAFTDIHYIALKALKDPKAVQMLLAEHFIKTVNIATVDSRIIHGALGSHWDDFEDCVQNTVAESISADYIVTRNPKDFIRSSIRAVTPTEFLELLAPVDSDTCRVHPCARKEDDDGE